MSENKARSSEVAYHPEGLKKTLKKRGSLARVLHFPSALRRRCFEAVLRNVAESQLC